MAAQEEVGTPIATEINRIRLASVCNLVGQSLSVPTVLEHGNGRVNFTPNSLLDEISCIFYFFCSSGWMGRISQHGLCSPKGKSQHLPHKLAPTITLAQSCETAPELTLAAGWK